MLNKSNLNLSIEFFLMYIEYFLCPSELIKEIFWIVQSKPNLIFKIFTKNLISFKEKAFVAILTPSPVHVPSSLIQIAKDKGVIYFTNPREELFKFKAFFPLVE